MATNNYPVTSSADDWQDGYSGKIDNLDELLVQSWWPSEDPGYDLGYADLDTSGIGTDTISAATLYWYHVNYAKERTLGYQRTITVGSATIFSDTSAPGAAGWHSHALTSGELAQINKTGKTRVSFYAGAGLGSTGYREWTIKAWDYGDHSLAVYLEVTHAPPGGPTKASIISL
jgi:hypothetical protein